MNTRRFWRRAERVIRAVSSHPYPVAVSCWLGVIFAERTAVHLVIYREVPSLLASVGRSATILCWLVASLLCLLAMLVDRTTVQRTLGSVSRLWDKVVHDAISPIMLAAVAVVVAVFALFRGSLRGEVIWWSIVRIVHDIRAKLDDIIWSDEAAVLIAVTVVYLGWLAVERFLKKREKAVEEAIYELIVAGYILGALGIFYFWFSSTVSLPLTTGEMRDEALAGLMKDTLVYTALALVVVVGTYKAAEALHAVREPRDRWAVWRSLIIGIAFVAIVLIVLDLHYREAILPTSQEYPEPWQKRQIRFHIMVRLALIIPLLIAAGLNMFGRIEAVNLRKGDQRR